MNKGCLPLIKGRSLHAFRLLAIAAWFPLLSISRASKVITWNLTFGLAPYDVITGQSTGSTKKQFTMKKLACLMMVACLGLFAASTQAQGLIQFANSPLSLVKTNNGTTGNASSTTGTMVELFYQPGGPTAPAPLYNPVTGVLTQGSWEAASGNNPFAFTTSDGGFNGGTVTTGTDVVPGSNAWLTVVAWTGGYATPQAAILSGVNGVLVGESTVFELTTGATNPVAITSAAIGGTTFTTFTLTPVPSTRFSNLTANTTFHYGASGVFLGGTLSANGPIWRTMGETITVTINGNAQTTTINDTSGDFSIIYNPSTLPASATPYVITYSYGGDGSLSPCSDSSTTLTVSIAPSQPSEVITWNLTYSTYPYTVISGQSTNGSPVNAIDGPYYGPYMTLNATLTNSTLTFDPAGVSLELGSDLSGSCECLQDLWVYNQSGQNGPIIIMVTPNFGYTPDDRHTTYQYSLTISQNGNSLAQRQFGINYDNVITNNMGAFTFSVTNGDRVTFDMLHQDLYGNDTPSYALTGTASYTFSVSANGFATNAIQTVNTPTNRPQITSAFFLNTTHTLLSVSGVGGPSNAIPYSYYVITATNPAAPISNWAICQTNNYTTNGSFSFIYSMNTNEPARFFGLKNAE